MTAARDGRADGQKPVLITGGAGFIGCNIAAALASSGRPVQVFDSLARPGVRENAYWLKSRFGAGVDIQTGDIRDPEAVTKAVAEVGAVLHLAGQVAVTTSIENPRDDFAINAAGTLNVLEAVREHNPAAPVLFASTNKVYGSLSGTMEMCRTGTRIEPAAVAARRGIGEDAPLDFHSPYGCSKARPTNTCATMPESTACARWCCA